LPFDTSGFIITPKLGVHETGSSPKAPEELADDAAVKAKVASTPGAIGYISDAAVDSTVKVVMDF